MIKFTDKEVERRVEAQTAFRVNILGYPLHIAEKSEQNVRELLKNWKCSDEEIKVIERLSGRPLDATVYEMLTNDR